MVKLFGGIDGFYLIFVDFHKQASFPRYQANVPPSPMRLRHRVSHQKPLLRAASGSGPSHPLPLFDHHSSVVPADRMQMNSRNKQQLLYI